MGASSERRKYDRTLQRMLLVPSGRGAETFDAWVQKMKNSPSVPKRVQYAAIHTHDDMLTARAIAKTFAEGKEPTFEQVIAVYDRMIAQYRGVGTLDPDKH